MLSNQVKYPSCRNKKRKTGSFSQENGQVCSVPPPLPLDLEIKQTETLLVQKYQRILEVEKKRETVEFLLMAQLSTQDISFLYSTHPILRNLNQELGTLVLNHTRLREKREALLKLNSPSTEKPVSPLTKSSNAVINLTLGQNPSVLPPFNLPLSPPGLLEGLEVAAPLLSFGPVALEEEQQNSSDQMAFQPR